MRWISSHNEIYASVIIKKNYEEIIILKILFNKTVG